MRASVYPRVIQCSSPLQDSHMRIQETGKDYQLYTVYVYIPLENTRSHNPELF